ncbi:MAG: cobalamin biosynthesis protein CobD [Eubacterium sp.]|nr:cobalamin biosynthesis protein CobD [Eubacterium sp.]
MRLVVVILLGFGLDLLFGDPARIPHPIVGIGKLISVTEKILRRIFPKSPGGELAAGVFLTVIVTCVSAALPLAAIFIAWRIDPRLAFALEVFWCWQIFAAKSLKQAAVRVLDEIEREDLPAARKYLSWIVGRDTQDLDFRQITKAVVETVAENASDGVIAPMLYLLIGGVPLGFFYKAVNTLDSMVGYKNETYLYFGRFSAKFDDLWNFIPARITGLLFCLAAPLAGLDGKNAFRIFRRDRKKHASPNAGNPESACAGALHVQLLGDAYYFGELYKKDSIGDDDRPIEAADIRRTNTLMITASALGLLILAACRIAAVILVTGGI